MSYYLERRQNAARLVPPSPEERLTRHSSPTMLRAKVAMMTNGEAFSRVKINQQLADVGWNLTDVMDDLIRHRLIEPDGD